MIDKEEVIFDFTNPNWKYKGILFANFDTSEMEKEIGFPPPSTFYGGFMAIIWIDENQDWIGKGRMKFSSGNKQIYSKNFGKKSSETEILQFFYQLPLKDKIWKKNPSEDVIGIIEIIKDLDMIESYKIILNN